MAKRTASSKRKATKRRSSEIVPDEPLDPYEEYGSSSPHNLTHEIRSEIDDGNRDLEELVNAIHAIDRYGVANPRRTKTLLVELLKSRGTTRAENALVADLIDRRILPHGRGRPRRPVYLITDDDHAILNALSDVEALRGSSGISVSDAIDRIAAQNKIPYDTLLDAHQGRRRSMRKTRK